MKSNKYVTLKIGFIALFVLTFTVGYVINKKNTNERIDLLLQANIEKVKLNRDYTIEFNKLLANAMYAKISNNSEILEILSQLPKSTETHKSILRQKLFDILKDEYTIMQSLGVSKIHFVDSNYKSFLRLHKQDKYGDDLFMKRYSYKYVHETLEHIDGFEVGTGAEAYRYVFPLFSKMGKNKDEKRKNYIGSVDISFSTEFMQDHLEKLTSSHSHLLIKKDIYFKKIFDTNEQSTKLVQSMENKDYLVVVREKEHKKGEKIYNQIGEQLNNKIIKKMAKNEKFDLYAIVDNNVKTIVFLPIKNIQGNDIISWLVVYGDNKAIYETIEISKYIMIVTFFGLLILFYFIYKSFLGKELLKDEIIKLNNSEQLLDTIFDTTVEGIAILDLESNFLHVNHAYEVLTGYTKEELYKLSCKKLTAPDSIKDNTKVMQKVLKKGVYLNFEKSCLVKDNKIIDVVMNIALMPDKERLLVTVTDVTLKNQAKRAQKAKKEAKKAKEHQMLIQSRYAQMGEMIAMIAHQWRQPLTAISARVNSLIFKTMMNEKIDNELFTKELIYIGEYSQHLSQTINDFREFFKENKTKEKTTSQKIIQSTLDIVQISLENQKIKVITHFDCGIEFETYANELKQVVLNIIKNAEDVLLEKEIENPTITIQTLCDIDGTNQSLIIKDNGGGIPKDVMDRIFEPYFSTKTNKNGTGLGLYMSKIIIEEHCNGRLTASNDKDGAVFLIEL